MLQQGFSMLYLIIGLTILVVAGAIRRMISLRDVRKVNDYLKKFTYDHQTNSYTEAFPRADLSGQPKLKHAVLLLHGYNGTPKEIEELCPYLKAAKIPYYAPLLVGHGLGSMELFSAAKPADWLRDAFNAFDLLAALADEVSVFGHSTGATLAFYLAQKRPIKHLILSSPNLVITLRSKVERFQKRLLDIPILSEILQWVIPFHVKNIKPRRVLSVDILDPKQAEKSFYFPVLPTRSIKVMYKLQKALDLSRPYHCQDLTVIYGIQDLTVDVPAGLELLDSHGIKYNKIAYAKTAHNVLEDYDREDAASRIIEILKS